MVSDKLKNLYIIQYVETISLIFDLYIEAVETLAF